MSSGERSKLTKICIAGSDENHMIAMPPTFEEFESKIKTLSGADEIAEYKVDGKSVNLGKLYDTVVGYPGVIYVEPEDEKYSLFSVNGGVLIFLTIACVCFIDSMFPDDVFF